MLWSLQLSKLGGGERVVMRRPLKNYVACARDRNTYQTRGTFIIILFFQERKMYIDVHAKCKAVERGVRFKFSLNIFVIKWQRNCRVAIGRCSYWD